MLQGEFELGSGPAADEGSVDNSSSLLFAPTFHKYIFSGFNNIIDSVMI